jgi:hypothetical protein
VRQQSVDPFSAEERERARRYHHPLYQAVVARVLLVIAVYGLLVGHGITGLGWARDAASWVATVTAAATIATLPLDLWRSFLREHRWRLSTQSLAGWLGDRAKAGLIGLVLATGAWTGLIAVTHVMPSWWPVAAAAAAALAVVGSPDLGRHAASSSGTPSFGPPANAN